VGRAVKPIRTSASRMAKPRGPSRTKSPIDKARPHEVVWQQVAPMFERARGIENASFVYFIGEPDDGPVKIGQAKDPVGRVRTMQTGNPRRLRIEHVLLGTREMEQLLHEMWEPFAIVSPARATKVDLGPGTEWFGPEIREKLMPIVETAVERQLDFLETAPSPIQPSDLAECVREAHADHDFVFRPRDVVRLLGATVGYARVGRGTRI
jgi:hypothetical protein